MHADVSDPSLTLDKRVRLADFIEYVHEHLAVLYKVANLVLHESQGLRSSIALRDRNQ